MVSEYEIFDLSSKFFHKFDLGSKNQNQKSNKQCSQPKCSDMIKMGKIQKCGFYEVLWVTIC